MDAVLPSSVAMYLTMIRGNWVRSPTTSALKRLREPACRPIAHTCSPGRAYAGTPISTEGSTDAFRAAGAERKEDAAPSTLHYHQSVPFSSTAALRNVVQRAALAVAVAAVATASNAEVSLVLRRPPRATQ